MNPYLRYALITSLILSALLGGCMSMPGRAEPTPTETMEAKNMPKTLRILALGDSYTIGEGVSPQERWPVRLAERLRAEGLTVDEPRIIARTGWTTDELASSIESAELDTEYDLVTLLIGVNNQYRGRSVEEYREQFRQLLNRAVELAGGRPERVIVLSIPDWGVTPFAQGRDRAAIAEQIDAFNLVKQVETEESGAWYVDITPFSREAARDGSLLAGDGLHPSGRMYAAWAEMALPAALDGFK
jgi:lysophospholipase L1-like esterase